MYSEREEKLYRAEIKVLKTKWENKKLVSFKEKI